MKIKKNGDTVLVVTVVIQRNPTRVLVQVFGFFFCTALSSIRYFELNFFEHKKVPPKSMWTRTMSLISLAYSRAVEVPGSVKARLKVLGEVCEKGTAALF